MTNQTPIPVRPNVNDKRRAMEEVPLPPISQADAANEAELSRLFPPDAPPAKEEQVAPAPAGPLTLTSIHEKLCKPFPLWAIEVKPGATTKDKTRAMAMAYADARVYQTRLDRLAGPEGWSVEYRAVGERAILCRLTILGSTREDVGECASAADENAWTSATMQAFKRACAAFGIGRYLYSLSKPWVEYDNDRRQIKNPEAAAQQIYAAAGLPVK